MRPHFDNGITRLYQADARSIPLPDESVHCVCTSPPYWSLRSYLLEPSVWGGDPEHAHHWGESLSPPGERKRDGNSGPKQLPANRRDAMPTSAYCKCGAWLGVLGLEPTVGEYVDHIVQVFREVRRVLRNDGVAWLNLGDAHASQPVGSFNGGGFRDRSAQLGTRDMSGVATSGAIDKVQGSDLPEKNLIGLPWRVVLALQADGWLLRKDHIYHKPSPMPESVHGVRWERCRRKVAEGAVFRHGFDRGVGHVNESNVGARDPTDAAQWEDCPGCGKCEPNDGYVLRRGAWRCTSSHEYIFMLVKRGDYYADGEAVETPSASDHPPGNGFQRLGRLSYENQDGTLRGQESPWEPAPTVNRRSVWSDIRRERYPGEHYATFPSDLPRICIQASTSEAGVCPGCGAQWARVVERTFRPQSDVSAEKGVRGTGSQKPMDATNGWDGTPRGTTDTRTIGWRPICRCDAGDPIPATVLDPFMGTGTTCLAAQRLGRRSVGLDLSGDYLSQAVKRLAAVPLPMDLFGSPTPDTEEK